MRQGKIAAGGLTLLGDSGYTGSRRLFLISGFVSRVNAGRHDRLLRNGATTGKKCPDSYSLSGTFTTRR